MKSLKLNIGYISEQQVLGDWYMDLSDIVRIIEAGIYGPFDDAGVPMVDYKAWFKNSSAEKKQTSNIHYTPETIANYALGNLSIYYRTKEESRIDTFIGMADWLVNHAKANSNFVIWEHTWFEPHYKLTPPWVSAMAQGLAISVLLRAYQITGEEKFFIMAREAVKSFEYSINNGGVKFEDEQGAVWFEEYPTTPPSHVLNGFIFALFGLYDYYRVTRDRQTFELWMKAIKTLENNLHFYSEGRWSRYDLGTKGLANFSYHAIHIMQLQILCNLHNSKIFLEYLDRWKRANSNAFIKTTVRTRLRAASAWAKVRRYFK